MVDTTENDAFITGLDLCVGLTENLSTTKEQSFSWQPDLSLSTWMGSQEVEGINNRLKTMDSKLNVLIAERTSGDDEHSNGPVAKRVSCCVSHFVLFCHYCS